MKYTTLNQIREHSPCYLGWQLLLISLDKTGADDEPLSFQHVLNTLSIKDATWCLRTLTYKEECLFRADLAELLLPAFETKHPEDNRPRKAIDAIRNFERGVITKEDLMIAHADAYAFTAVLSASTMHTTAYGMLLTIYTRIERQVEVEELFIKHFCGGDE